MAQDTYPFGEHRFTARQIEVISLVVKGNTRMGVAIHMGVSKSTVDNHLRIIYLKLGIHSLGALIVKALDNGFDSHGGYTPPPTPPAED